jgi:WD40 repeat protein
MDDKVPPDEALATRTEAEGATVDLPEGLGFFSTGQVLGERYEVLEMLGRGGMGEVWRAFDLKLRVEVALKALREDLFQSEGRLELLRQEVRAAREVMSPNVCRIFDLHELDGRELVSMEYVDGATLLGVLQERGPLELKEAQDIASQFLSGLEAIHKSGLVHRDVKPENIMLTRAGRVVVMDFGLARGPESGAGSVSGTPAYMAPEHASGQEVDARADVYSAGVVLAEMVSPEGIKSYESRQSVWEGVRSEPAKVPDSPWAAVIQRAVAKDRDRRQNSAHTLIRELEEVTLRVEGAEDLHPYPGLASFTEEDAEFFFGREAEVERLWRKLDGPSRLLGLVGPSGAGKTSFLQAGLIAHAGPGWRCVISKPGTNPVLGLSRALAPEMAGDVEAMDLLLRFDDSEVAIDVVSRWRRTTDRALIIVDQFEELFTQNAADEQRRLADLLGRLVLESDVFVILSMRDDFMMRCRDLEALEPIFSEMTALPALAGGSLRRALVRPATKCGYRFEDDELVEEILAEVEGERGALPMLAFAASRLWEKRDRESGLLTRQAYHDIGGVGGALARHAEATVDRIGVERIPIVRELFRNLVTAEGTRAVREWDELLSVFESEKVRKLEGEKVGGRERFNRGDDDPHCDTPSDSERSERSLSHSSLGRNAAEEVLRELIDARLLTSYEVREDEHEPIRRVEIIHESLLANWPRLVRWQTQDADAVQIREQLRQAARTWDEHDRTDDMLWTGSAYRQYSVWRESYPGGLTEVEDAYASAMTSYATRRTRRRRIAVTSAIIVLLVGLAIVGAFWRRSVAETRRAEAQKLLALGQLEFEAGPSIALAYSIASLELADTPEARFMALQALWRGPTAFIVDEDDNWPPAFSPDGRWLAQSIHGPESGVRIVRSDGSVTNLERVHTADTIPVSVSPDSDIILSTSRLGRPGPEVALWSAPDGRLITSYHYEDDQTIRAVAWSSSRVLVVVPERGECLVEAVNFDGTRERLGTLPFDIGLLENNSYAVRVAMDVERGRWIAVVDDNEVWSIEIGNDGVSEPRLLGRHEGSFVVVAFDPTGRSFATLSRVSATPDANRRILTQIWDPTGVSPPRKLEGPAGELGEVGLLHHGSMLSVVLVDEERQEEPELRLWLWSLTGDEPQLLRRFDLGKDGPATWVSVDTVQGTLARVDWDRMIRIWPLNAPAGAEPIMVGRGEIGQLWPLVFDPTGRWLASSSQSGLALWPLARPYPSVLRHDVKQVGPVAFGPNGHRLFTSAGLERVRLWPLDGDIPAEGRVLFDEGPCWFAISPEGQTLLISNKKFYSDGDILLSLADGSRRALLGFDGQTSAVAFSPDGRFAAGAGGTFSDLENVIRVWDVASGDELIVLEPEADLYEWVLQFTPENRLLSSGRDGLRRWNVETGESELLHEGMVGRFSASADGRRLVFLELDRGAQYGGRAVFLDLETGAANPLEGHGDEIFAVALNQTGEVVATGDLKGVIRVSSAAGGEPHLLLGHEAIRILDLALDPQASWLASSAGDSTARLWPMPDLSKPPLHTLPREELIAKLKTLTNLRVVRDPESATGWKLTHDPFPGWETVPTW